MQSSTYLNDFKLFDIENFGIALDQDQKMTIERKMNQLKNLVPIKASIQLNFEKRRRNFKGELKINTLKTQFVSISWGGDPLETFSRMEKDIKQKINYWKKKRFDKELDYREVV